MNGLFFDWETHDIAINGSGAFSATEVSSQTCALIALSHVCRLTKPELGADLANKLVNRRHTKASRFLAEAERMVERDGGRRVSITLDEQERLQFEAEYGDDLTATDYVQPPSALSLADIPIGTNVRGWKFAVTNTGKSAGGWGYPDGTELHMVFNDTSVDDNPDVIVAAFEGQTLTEPAIINLYLDSLGGSQLTVKEGTGAGSWNVTEFTMPNDKDYIVTANSLPRGTATRWGFENIIKI